MNVLLYSHNIHILKTASFPQETYIKSTHPWLPGFSENPGSQSQV